MSLLDRLRRRPLPEHAVEALRWHHDPAVSSEPGPAEQARSDWPAVTFRDRLRWVRTCRRRIGHCWHMTPDASPMAPEWVCCSCPDRRDGIPAHECRRCRPG